jgi:hypothetical protein
VLSSQCSGKAVAVIYTISHDWFLFSSNLQSFLNNDLDHVQPASTRLFLSPVSPIANSSLLVYTMLHSILAFVVLIYSQTIAFLHPIAKAGANLDHIVI